MFRKAVRYLCLLAILPGSGLAQDAPKNLTLLGIPSATTAPGGVVFGQVSRSTSLGSNTENRTVLAFGAGIGDADDGLGGQLTVVGSPESATYDSFSYVNAKVSRRLSAASNPTYLGFSVDRVAGNGEASDLDPSYKLMLSRFGTVTTAQDTYPVIVTLGAGSHLRNDYEDPGVFFGAGIGLSPGLGVSAAWSGEQVDLGASFRFGGFDNARLAVVVTDAFAQENRRQLTVGLSWSFDLSQGR